MNPVARKNGLVVRDLSDEVLVYDLDRHEAHCLNQTAAAVFRAADGTRSVSDIARLLATDAAVADEEIVRMALERLGEVRLLEAGPASPAGSRSVAQGHVSRRDVMRRVGLGVAVLLPIVTSVLAPTPAEAVATCVTNCSGQPNGTLCTCVGASPCTSSCVGGICMPDGTC